MFSFAEVWRSPAVKSGVRFFFLGGSPEYVRQAKVKLFLTNDSMDACVYVYGCECVCLGSGTISAGRSEDQQRGINPEC